jgi:hypothetical protein
MKKRLKKYLIPHRENDYKPHLLRPKFVALVCLVVVVAESAFLFGAHYLVPRSKLFGIIVTNALVDETNQSRTSNDLPALHENSLLDAAAQLKANDMVANNYFAHTSPAGLTPWYWFEQVGYNFNYAGENLAVNFSDSQDVTNAWMNSPEHRANILDGNYTDIGMATAQGTYEGHPATYVVELFGSEAPAPVASSVSVPGISTAQAANPAPAPTAKPKPVAQKLAPKPTSTLATATSEQSFVAVQGAATQTVSTTQAVSTTQLETTSTGVLGSVSSDNDSGNGTPPVIKQTNAIQQALSDPKALANDFYLFLMVVFGIALGLNIFIKIRVQYPNLIFGGLLVIVIAGLAIMLNQSALAHIAIL